MGRKAEAADAVTAVVDVADIEEAVVFVDARNVRDNEAVGVIVELRDLALRIELDKEADASGFGLEEAGEKDDEGFEPRVRVETIGQIDAGSH